MDTRNVSVAFVYDNPTIQSLAIFMTEFSNRSKGVSPEKMVESKVKEMEALVSKYGEDFLQHKSTGVVNGAESQGDVALLTGSTGGLGSALLANLLSSSDFTRVYALNRRATKPLPARQQTAFEERGLDTSLLRSEKLTLLEGDTAKENLGLDKHTYDEVCAIIV